ncbi:MAG: hypothetical protein HOV67_25725, partial [Kribbellaceae bacterium]|nr:hypothetical protein [Kribbellaceae bacterium]
GVLPDGWRRVAEVLPFYGMNGLPASVASGAPAGGSLGYQLAWVAVLVGAAVVMWRAGVRRYTAVGS